MLKKNGTAILVLVEATKRRSLWRLYWSLDIPGARVGGKKEIPRPCETRRI